MANNQNTHPQIKLAMVVNRFPALTETFILRQAIALNAVVITTDYSPINKDGYDVHDLTIHELRSARNINSIGHKILSRTLRTSNSIWITPSVSEELESILKKERINVVLAQFGTNGVNVHDTCQRLKIPFVIQFLGYDASSLLNSRYYHRRLQRALADCAKAIVLYNGMKNQLQKLVNKEDLYETINLGVPIKLDSFMDRDDNKIVEFLAVGRLVPKKAPLNLLKAFQKSLALHPNSRLSIVGDGPLLKECAKFVERNDLKDFVVLHGAIPHDDVVSLFLRADVFLQHSVTSPNGEKEGWPVSIAEACAYGLPVISTIHAGIPDQIVDGFNGYLVPEHDINMMAEKMTKLASSYSLRIEMGSRSYQHIKNHGEQMTQIQKLKNVLAKCVSA